MSSGLVLGFVTGLTYGLLAVGIVLIYRANRFINLAHAQLGAVSALLLGRFVLEDGWSWWVAFPAVIAVGVGTGMLIERVVIRRMLRRKRHGVSLLLVTIGVAQLLLALTYVPSLGPSNTALYREGFPVPFETEIDLGSFVLGGQHILILLLVPAAVAALAAFLRWSVWGKAIRAAASNHDAARLCGIPVARVSALSWGIAGGLSAVTAVLQAPSQGSFDAAALGPGLLLRSLGAAALGGFTSIPWALAGGLLIAEAEHLVLGIKHQAGSAELVVLLVVVAILFLRGRAITAGAASDAPAEDAAPVRIPPALRDRAFVRWAPRCSVALLLLLAVLLPVMPFFHTEGHRFQLVVTLVMAIAGVALTMLAGWAGQVSLGHFALLGLGAYLTGKLEPHGLSLLVILAAAALVGAGVMAIIGIPALRLQGLTLALTTLGFAVVAPVWLFQQPWLGASGQAAVTIDPPGVAGVGRLGSQLSIYYAALALLVLVILAALRIRRSMPGRLMLAVRDNERAVASLGFMPSTVKLSILAVSGAIVAMGGVLWGAAWRTMSIELVPPDSSLVLLAIPVIGGLGSVVGAVAGSALVYLPTFFVSPLLDSVFGDFGKQIGFQLALAGAGLVVMPLAYPAGLAGVVRDAWQRLLDRLATTAAADERAVEERPLVVEGVTKRFGVLQVLTDVDLEVRPGEIVGLIGPNGAGKTTLMNVVSGDLRNDTGTVRVLGRDVTALAPELRAHVGLGRNYQEARLFPGLTVREAVQVAVSRAQRVSVLSVMLAAPWARHVERGSRRRAEEIIERLGLTPWAEVLTGDLSTGTRRICELATQVAAAPRMLLLDEPTAGVAQREAEEFGPLLRRIRDELDCSILIVEHDMPLLMGVCDRIYAMQTGTVIAEGTPAEIREHPEVIASYLGTDEIAVNRSGSRVATGTAS